jgi:NarL family two-component system response regulator LiaR
MLFSGLEAASVDCLLLCDAMEPARPSTIRVLLVDGHRAVADALAKLLDAERDIHVVGLRSSVRELNDDHAVDFDVALTRYLLPDGNGADATRVLKRRWPERKVVVLLAVTDAHAATRVRRAGADVLVGRVETGDELIKALRAAYRGRASTPAVPPGTRRRSRSRVTDPRTADTHDLTPRELDVLRALVLGRTTAQICAQFGIGPNTVRTHVQNLIGKLRVHSRLEAVAVATREHIV